MSVTRIGVRPGLLFGGAQAKGKVQQSEPLPKRQYSAPSAGDTFHYRSKLGKPARQTNVESLIGGGQIFHKIDEMLASAESDVMLSMYTLQHPDLNPESSSVPGTYGATIQAQLVDRLVELQARGVKVRVILDDHKRDKDSAERHGEMNQNDKVAAYLKERGVEVVKYPRKLALINHVKVLLVDVNSSKPKALVSGMNWGNHSPTNHDSGIYLQGPDVRNLYAKLFYHDYKASGGDMKGLPEPNPFRRGKIKVLQTRSVDKKAWLDGTGPAPKDEIFREIVKQVDNAERSIYVEMFALTDKTVAKHLIQAHRRLRANNQEGVKILVDPGLFFDLPNTQATVKELARQGVPIKFLHRDTERNRPAEERLHGKWAVFDEERVLVGSANWSAVGLLANGIDHAREGEPKQRVSRGNHELNLFLESEKLGKAFANQARYDWFYRSFPVLSNGNSSGQWRPIIPLNLNAELGLN